MTSTAIDPDFLDTICVIPGARLADAVRDAAAAGAHPALARLSPGCADPDVLAACDRAADAMDRAAALYRQAAATLAGRQH